LHARVDRFQILSVQRHFAKRSDDAVVVFGPSPEQVARYARHDDI
jgi:hypothetical protein